jgi:flagellar biosynthesis/type III secretory pathway M-ring protein FliF/YscJ
VKLKLGKIALTTGVVFAAVMIGVCSYWILVQIGERPRVDTPQRALEYEITKKISNFLSRIYGDTGYYVSVSTDLNQFTQSQEQTRYSPQPYDESQYSAVTVNDRQSSNQLVQLSTTNLQNSPEARPLSPAPDLPGFPAGQPPQSEGSYPSAAAPANSNQAGADNTRELYSSSESRQAAMNSDEQHRTQAGLEINRMAISIVIDPKTFRTARIPTATIYSVIQTISNLNPKRSDTLRLDILPLPNSPRTLAGRVLPTLHKIADVAQTGIHRWKYAILTLGIVLASGFATWLFLRRRKIQSQTALLQTPDVDRDSETVSTKIETIHQDLVTAAREKPTEFANALLMWINNEDTEETHV